MEQTLIRLDDTDGLRQKSRAELGAVMTKRRAAGPSGA
jgi:hypothetical protein